MIKVIEKDGRVYLFLEEANDEVTANMKGFNRAGVDICTPYAKETYRINGTDNLVRLSISSKVVEFTTVEKYEERKKKFSERMESIFAN